jgi:polysaccharide biosynthesis/export protein
MFRVSEDDNLKQQLDKAEDNYVIQKNDLLQLSVFTNKGEKIIDPNQEINKETPSSQTATPAINYLVDINGVVKFPQINEIKLEGLTIRQAEQILEKEYNQPYVDAFVILKFINKRVVVLGAPGGQVIPLTNENTRLVEVLALAKGISNDAKAHNIRILRGTQIMTADLTTFEGYLNNNIIMQPGDIIYVEPIRRPFLEGFREFGPIISIITSLGTLIYVISQTTTQP